MITFFSFLIIILAIKLILLTQRLKKTEKQLKTLEEKETDIGGFHRAFLDSVYRVAIIATDTEGVIKFFNKGAEELLGFTSEEMIGKATPLVFHDRDEVEKRAKYLSHKLHKHIEGFDTFVAYSEIKGYENKEWIYIKKDGNRIVVDLYVSPIKDEKENLLGYVGLARSINERLEQEKTFKNDIKILHKKINEKSKTISNLNKELRIVTYNLSHSIKTPLHGINQISQWLQEDYKDVLNKDVLELLKLLNLRVEKVNGLINNLLQYTNIKKENQKNYKTDLNEVIKNILEFMTVPENIQIIFTSNFPSLKIEKRYIESIFFNLIDNSIKYMDKPKGFVEIGMIELKKQYLFFIKDNGPGIDERYHEKVFDMFQSLNDETNIENLGVGLSLTKKIIEIHGGVIKLESRTGEGTSVFFTLPIN